MSIEEKLKYHVSKDPTLLDYYDLMLQFNEEQLKEIVARYSSSEQDQEWFNEFLKRITLQGYASITTTHKMRLWYVHNTRKNGNTEYVQKQA